MPRQEIITRRNLPHWYVPGAMHFVTYRLAGTVPQEVLLNLKEKRTTRLQQKPPDGLSLGQHKARLHKQFFADYDHYLDHRCPIDWLSKPPIAALIRGNLYHHHGSQYHLLAYCVMPHHVHVLVQPIDDDLVATSGPLVRPPASACAATQDCDADEKADAASPLAAVMHSLKSYTAHKANALLGRSGPFWQHESYDHWVRDEDELERVIDYIAWNPVKADLVKEPHQWFFCSAHDRFLQDGSKRGFLS